MPASYDDILNLLKSKFKTVFKKNKTYFLDENGSIVASYDENSIVMYFAVAKDSDKLWNHKGIAIATFIKDFQVNNIIADVIILTGLCGSSNDSEVIDNRVFDVTTNREIFRFNCADEDIDALDNMSESEKRAHFREVTGANVDETTNFEGMIFSSDEDEAAIGSCGSLTFTGDLANIEICKEISINNITVDKSEEYYDVNILRYKGVSKNAMYGDVYNYWRLENDWHYDQGYNSTGSPENRIWTENRRTSNIDESDIYFIGNPFKDLLDPIYFNTVIPFDLRISQMRRIMTDLVGDKLAGKVLKLYDTQDKSLDVGEDITRM